MLIINETNERDNKSKIIYLMTVSGHLHVIKHTNKLNSLPH